jgi:hypothetical protein
VLLLKLLLLIVQSRDERPATSGHVAGLVSQYSKRFVVS